MTWVIGIPGLITGAAVMADTQITLEYDDGRLVPAPFGVQKIHAVAPWIVVGFSGPVDLGLQVVEDLQRWLDPPFPDNWGLAMSHATWHWARRLRYIWRKGLPAVFHKKPFALLVIGAGEPRRDSSFPVTFGYILRAPDFGLEPIPAQTARSIGSGSALPLYREALAQVFDADSPGFWSAMNASLPGGDMGGFLWFMAHVVDKHVETQRDATVGEHLHLAWVRAGEIMLTINDEDTYVDENAVPFRRMPEVVTTLAEYRAKAQALGWKAGAAVG
jgi:hypothetical protein